MRIVAGEWKGRRIKAPSGSSVRPTRDRVREAWMSIIALDIPGAIVADVFAGSGALGIEALSRGARHAEFVDSDARSLTVLRANLDALGAGERASVRRADGLRYVAALPDRGVDIVLADPPYASDAATRLATRWLELPYAALLCIEHSSSVKMPEGGDTRRYGVSSITFYRAD